MKQYYFILFFLSLLISPNAIAQETDNAALLKVIFTKYFKNEKVIAKGRLQLLSFYCKKAPNNEEVLEVLIDRMNFLQSKFPCRENAIVITKLEESLMWLNKRTQDRLKRNVEGKHLA